MKKENKCSNFLDYKVIGQEVRNRRLAKGYTQKDLAKKIDTTYQVILQYEKGTRRISIKKLYELAEALSTTARDLACGQEVSNEERYEEEEILNLVRRHKEIKDQELRETFYLLTKFIRISEEESGKAVKVEVAKGLVKEGVSAHVISQTTSLSIDEYDNDEKKISIPYKVGQRIKEWRLRRGYTQEDLASKVGIINQRIYEYEQGRAAVSLEMLDEIARELSVNIKVLLPETRESKEENKLLSLIKALLPKITECEDENSKKLLSLMDEYREDENQESLDALVKSLSEDMKSGKEKVKKAEKIRVAKNLSKADVSIDIILRASGLTVGELGECEN